MAACGGVTTPPNVLLIVADQHRADWMTYATPDLPLRTPALDELAGRGVAFRRAITPAPVCAPARACLATGRNYDTCPVADNRDDLPPGLPTYYRLLRDQAGYHVTGVGKFDLHKATRNWGLDGTRLLREWGMTTGCDNEGKLDAVASGWPVPQGPYMAWLHAQGLAERHVSDFAARRGPGLYRNTQPTPLVEDAYEDNWIAANAVRFLRDCPRGKPWHLVVNFAGPHDPMDVTERMWSAWREASFPGPADSLDSDLAVHQDIRRNYAAMIENIDRHVGTLVDLVAARGELDRTLVVYTSDHGDMLGDHGLWGKAVYHQPSIGIPLVVAGPGVEHDRVSDALVSLEDLAATFLDLAGVAPDPGMTARSLRSVLEGTTTTHRDAVVTGLDLHTPPGARSGYETPPGWSPSAQWRAVLAGSRKLVLRGPEDPPLLFDLQADPHELTDISGNWPGVVEALTTELDRHCGGVSWRLSHGPAPAAVSVPERG